jgi:2-polyprenyl-3-methyl-5-hydroxy-6-metoxy-1,4-benzoquinol methylase
MFKTFKQRSTHPELMDDQGTGFHVFGDCLHDLRIVNICSLAYRPILSWLRQTIAGLHSSRSISIIDVGSGGGDTLRKIAQWAIRHKQAVDLTGVDLNAWSKQYADQATPASLNIKFETADIFDFAPTRQVDFIISSLFTHHLDDEQLVRFLRWMEIHAKQGWLINDLHRHPVAYFLIKYASRLLGFHYMVQHDGPVSVARGFTKSEWIRHLTQADIPSDQIEICWFFPFRYRVVRRMP